MKYEIGWSIPPPVRHAGWHEWPYMPELEQQIAAIRDYLINRNKKEDTK